MGDYVTLTEVKDLLQDLQGDTTYDSFLNKAITRSSKDVDRLTDQFFDARAGVTKIFDGSGTRTLFLPWSWPLITVTSLQVKIGGEGTSFVTVPSADYFLEPAGRPLGDPARWIELATRPTGSVSWFACGKGTVSIAGDWGRSAILEEIKEVCLEMIVNSWRNRAKGGSGLPGGGPDDPDDQLTMSLSPRSRAILKKHGWKRPLMA